MRRRLLVITKDPEFDMRGEVVLGQCEPFTSGWSLILIHPDRRREVLTTGTYTDLRKLQESCREIDEPEKLRKRINDLRALLMSSVTETIAVRLSDQEHTNVETRPLDPVTSRPLPRQSPSGLFDLSTHGLVVLAVIVQPEKIDDAAYLRRELLAVLDFHPRSLVLDFGRVPALSEASTQELLAARDLLRENGSGFALCNTTRPVQQRLRALRANESLAIFDSQSAALSALQH